MPLPLTRDLLLIGGGHAHALLLRAWGMDPLPGVRVTLVNPDPAAPYTGMLPGHVAGHYARDAMMIDLAPLCAYAGARLILGRAEAIDRAARTVRLEGGRRLRYDVASIDVGITSDLPDLPGFADHGHAAKPLGRFAAAWDAFVARGLAFPRVAVIGGGAAGVELAMAAAHRLRARGARPEVALLERGPRILGGLGEAARRALSRHLAASGVEVVTGAAIEAIGPDHVALAGGRRIGSDFTLSAAGARAPAWLAATGLGLHEGYAVTGPTLQSSDPRVFAVGDCAHMAFAPRPKAGVHAVRQAPVLHANLRAALSGNGRMRRHRPQRDYLKLVSAGGRGAVAERFGLVLDGPRMWRWKDRIDRRFMDRLADLPAMPRAPLPEPRAAGIEAAPGDRPLCGGCGAKVGPEALRASLAALPAPRRAEVVSGPGDDAAVLRVEGGFQVITTDHLRAFDADPALVARIAAVHALGDVWAMGAGPQGALAQVTLPPAGAAIEADMLAEVMAAAAEVFGTAGADLLGGHTSVGAELTVGFTVTGLARRIVGKGGARPGSALVLTKALGTGTLLAAGMARTRLPGLLLGECLAAARASMLRPLGAAAAVLRGQAQAMTDVTGFGLAGHLMEMMRAAGTAAALDLDAVPVLSGAVEAAALGIASSLAPANRAALAGAMTVADTPRAGLLFDPQTAGGLLAAVPAEAAEGLVLALRALGEPAAVIGHVAEGPPRLTVRG